MEHNGWLAFCEFDFDEMSKLTVLEIMVFNFFVDRGFKDGGYIQVAGLCIGEETVVHQQVYYYLLG